MSNIEKKLLLTVPYGTYLLVMITRYVCYVSLTYSVLMT
jgi:hypothetical protein